ncbi:MAG: pre-toxin TG domain-containing protein, partial [Proteobacteria bacterium]|nr:pre-toxin TG domain-containing protein [Pseudomonadota bacterium]
MSLARTLEATKAKFAKLSSGVFSISDGLLATALGRLGKSSLTDSDCDQIPGLRTKLNQYNTDPVGATDAIIHDHIQPSRSNNLDYNNLLALACWAKAHGERKASTKSADHIAAIKSAKHIANELGHEDINFQLAKQRTRVTDARSRLVSYTKPDREQKQAAVDQAELALDMAEEALADNDKETASHAIDYAIIALDFATEIGPFGFGKALISVTTGKNPITGETLEPIDYVFAAVDILDPLGGTKIARKAAKYALEIISKSKKSRAVAEKILDGVKTVDKIAAKGKYPCALTLTSVGDCIPKNIPIGEITDEMIEKG